MCRNCGHDCHCNDKEHIDEYLDICTCKECNCKHSEIKKEIGE
jgi:hypothetical protein